MAYAEKIYVAYDGSNDLNTYENVKGWVQSNGAPYDFIDGYDIFKEIDKTNDDVLKVRLRESMTSVKVCVLLIGQFTKSYRKFTRWQIECAINNDIPIIAININGIRSVDYDRCPTILKKNLSIHIAFQSAILEYALENWPQSHKEHRLQEKNLTYRYGNSVYESLHLETFDLE
jgi:hypothetical protein